MSATSLPPQCSRTVWWVLHSVFWGLWPTTTHHGPPFLPHSHSLRCLWSGKSCLPPVWQGFHPHLDHVLSWTRPSSRAFQRHSLHLRNARVTMEDLNCLMTQTSTSVADLTPFANTLHLYIPPCLRTLAALNRCETCFNWVWILQLTQHNFACTWTVQDTWSIYIVHPESPWTKDAAIFCVRTFNFLCTDACGRTLTQTHAHGRTQTYANFFSCILCPICYMFRPWGSLPANTCPMLVAFQDPEIQLALNWCFRNPAHKPKVLRTSASLGNLAWFLNMFYWEVLAVRWSLLACIWPKINTVGTWSMFPKLRPQTKSAQN